MSIASSVFTQLISVRVRVRLLAPTACQRDGTDKQRMLLLFLNYECQIGLCDKTRIDSTSEQSSLTVCVSLKKTHSASY